MYITEIFYSIQGEGALVGQPTIFIRTTGCNLRCTYCDTTYAYDNGKNMNISTILSTVKKYPCSTICITGGEPLLQPQTLELIDMLLKENYDISVETNGSIAIDTLIQRKKILVSLDYKCPHSQMQDKMNTDNLACLRSHDQLKFILYDQKDYTYAKKILTTYRPHCLIFFQPVWGTDPKQLLSWILCDGLPVRLSLQLHKILWGDKHGV